MSPSTSSTSLAAPSLWDWSQTPRATLILTAHAPAPAHSRICRLMASLLRTSTS